MSGFGVNIKADVHVTFGQVNGEVGIIVHYF